MTHPFFRAVLTALLASVAYGSTWAQVAHADDPFHSFAWPDLHKAYLGGEPFVFDARVQVSGPAFAEDPMNVPISVDAKDLPDVTQIVVLVDRNPIRKVLAYYPQQALLPRVSFRFKMEQASPVRAAAKTKDGVWHVGSTWVESSGGGCTVAGATRQDGSWSKTLGLVSSRVFDQSPDPAQSTNHGARLRLRVMHPMDTGLVGGIPAFYLNRLQVSSSTGEPLLKMDLFEPVSENPVFSFDFAQRIPGPLVLTGTDNNGNRVAAQIE
ncbi:MAG: quinoprotein dehydrogenase-associated SoxYZ-like carrier [Rhodoferax sp.]|uniref:quinoprotein dehydrogenase-associated SoxYZ-like carrier n=1 Tax=Rhodoferax sp. TaxID=50421 RepID=UPI003015BBA4